MMIENNNKNNNKIVSWPQNAFGLNNSRWYINDRNNIIEFQSTIGHSEFNFGSETSVDEV